MAIYRMEDDEGEQLVVREVFRVLSEVRGSLATGGSE